MPKEKPRSEEAAETRAQVRDWLQALMARFDVTPAKIGKATGINQATIYRLLRAEHDATLDTIMRIAAAYRVPPPGPGDVAPGMREPEAARWEGPPPEAGAELTPNQSWWKVNGRALELVGVLPGDAALLDQSAPARPGDLVIAQIYDFEHGSAETKIRYFDGLYLQTRTMDASLDERPVMVDGERAALMGRIVRLVRRMD